MPIMIPRQLGTEVQVFRKFSAAAIGVSKGLGRKVSGTLDEGIWNRHGSMAKACPRSGLPRKTWQIRLGEKQTDT